MTNMLLSLQTMPYQYRFCVYITLHGLLGKGIWYRHSTTYTPTTLTKEKIQDDHRSVLCSFGILTKDEDNKTNDINFLFSSVLCCLGFIIRSFNFAYRVEYSHILPKDLQ